MKFLTYLALANVILVVLVLKQIELEVVATSVNLASSLLMIVNVNLAH